MSYLEAKTLHEARLVAIGRARALENAARRARKRCAHIRSTVNAGAWLMDVEMLEGFVREMEADARRIRLAAKFGLPPELKRVKP